MDDKQFLQFETFTLAVSSTLLMGTQLKYPHTAQFRKWQTFTPALFNSPLFIPDSNSYHTRWEIGPPSLSNRSLVSESTKLLFTTSITISKCLARQRP